LVSVASPTLVVERVDDRAVAQRQADGSLGERRIHVAPMGRVEASAPVDADSSAGLLPGLAPAREAPTGALRLSVSDASRNAHSMPPGHPGSSPQALPPSLAIQVEPLKVGGLATSLALLWWAFRMSGLAAGMFAARSVWRQWDPLPVFDYVQDGAGQWTNGDDPEFELDEAEAADLLAEALHRESHDA